MAQRIKACIGAILLRLGEWAVGDRDARSQILKAIRVEDLKEDGSVAPPLRGTQCTHYGTQIKAPVMGRPLKWICSFCGEDGDGRIDDGD